MTLSRCIHFLNSIHQWVLMIWPVCAGYVCAQQARGPAKCWGENLKKSNHLWKCRLPSSKPKIGFCSKSLLWGIKKFIVILLFPDWSARTYLQLFRLPQGVDGHSHLCPANEKCCWQVSKEFMMSPNKLHLECSLDKELYYHGETISVNVHIQVRSHITTYCVGSKIGPLTV